MTTWQEELAAEILDDGVDPHRRTYLAYVLMTTGPRPANPLVRDLQSLEASLRSEAELPLKRILAEANRQWTPRKDAASQTSSGMGGMGSGGD